jgi:dethiobiotin synthetase
MKAPIFITGTGTNVGKTIASIIIVNALDAQYWKPVQAGIDKKTDSQRIKKLSTHKTIIHPETYKLKLAASPHIAAREEGLRIDLDKIVSHYRELQTAGCQLVIEGAGGLLVPLNEDEKVIDLVRKLNAKVILVSRNYLGSINHSLLTAEVCRHHSLDVAGWIFNDDYMEYEDEISLWSGYPVIGKIPGLKKISRNTLYDQSSLLRNNLLRLLESANS